MEEAESESGGRAVPRISLERLARRDDASELSKLRRALVDEDSVGWFELHAPAFDVKSTYDAARNFFALPTDVKAQYVHSGYANESGGFVPLLEEYAYVSSTAAYLESFDTVRELEANFIETVRRTKGDDSARGLGPVDWPIEVPEMRGCFKEFYAQADAAARVLLRAFAEALDLDADTFLKDFGDTSHCSMRAMRYPCLKSQVSTAERECEGARRSRRLSGATAGRGVELVGISEHTDFEFFTLLHQTCGGLELKGRDGKWRSASAYPEEPIFTVIVADAFEIFTNGVVLATPHRVRPSTEGRERFSLVRFNGLNHDACITPLPKFLAPGISVHNEKYASRTQGDHVGKSVTRASDNLEEMLLNNSYPKSELTKPPKRFAQMIIIDKTEARILLCEHLRGEFEGRFTGFIAPVKHDEDFSPLDVARITALENAGLNPRALDMLEPSDIRERGRFRFYGWMEDGEIAVEHEFIAVFSRQHKKFVDTLFNTLSEASTTTCSVPTWFSLADIPYDSMPEDDAKWYPKCIQHALSASAAVNPYELTTGHFLFDDDGALTEWSTHDVPYTAPDSSPVEIKLLARSAVQN